MLYITCITSYQHDKSKSPLSKRPSNKRNETFSESTRKYKKFKCEKVDKVESLADGKRPRYSEDEDTFGNITLPSVNNTAVAGHREEVVCSPKNHNPGNKSTILSVTTLERQVRFNNEIDRGNVNSDISTESPHSSSGNVVTGNHKLNTYALINENMTTTSSLRDEDYNDASTDATELVLSNNPILALNQTSYHTSCTADTLAEWGLDGDPQQQLPEVVDLEQEQVYDVPDDEDILSVYGTEELTCNLCCQTFKTVSEIVNLCFLLK